MAEFDPLEPLVDDSVTEEELADDQDSAALAESEPPEEPPVSLFTIFAAFLLLLALFIGLIFAQEFLNPQKSQAKKPLAEATQTTKVLKTLTSHQELPNLDLTSWELILVGPKHVSEELSPDLNEVSGILVDSRIAEATANFLAAAQAIDPTAHLVTGYRSVADQSNLYETFIAQEMEAQGITREGAIPFVDAYFQAPGTSEHMTGLAIDLSTVDYVNLMDPAIAEQLATIAPDYGFVLRYKESYETQTGVRAEDWHFRYVGVEAARYLADFDMPLETFLAKLAHASGQTLETNTTSDASLASTEMTEPSTDVSEEALETSE